MKVARCLHGCAAVQGKVYAIGGGNGEGTVSQTLSAIQLSCKSS